MGRRGEKADRIRELLPPTTAREALERRWFIRLERGDGELANLVTARGCAIEPFHRWIHYRQGFSPKLVRMFLQHCALIGTGGVVLDSFSGSGALTIEAARNHVSSIGVDASRSMTFLSAARFVQEFPPFPDHRRFDSWQDIASELDFPIHLAALMAAEGLRNTSEGKLNKNAMSLHVALDQMIDMFTLDMRNPLPDCARHRVGDARNLPVEDDGVDAILTSPPYLSRHNYSRIQKPYEQMIDCWVAENPEGFHDFPTMDFQAAQLAEPGDDAETVLPHRQAGQIRAATRKGRAGRSGRYGESLGRGRELHDAAAESVIELRHIKEPGLADLVCDYFESLGEVVSEWTRVLKRGCVGWVVIAGARLKGAYVPSDLILAEMVEASGLQVEQMVEARRLVDTGRKLGGLARVGPRETVVRFRKP